MAHPRKRVIRGKDITIQAPAAELQSVDPFKLPVPPQTEKQDGG